MFDFGGLYRSGIRPHWGAFLIVLFLVVIFLSAPFLFVWRAAKRAPVVGPVLQKVPGAAA